MEKLIYVRGIRQQVAPSTPDDMRSMLKSAQQVILCNSGTVVFRMRYSVIYVDGMTQAVLDGFSFELARPYNLDADKPNEDFWETKGGLVFDNCAQYFGSI